MGHVDVTKPIMVIGAGIAGLRVAEGLADAGAHNITVLERYPNVGGRIVTNRQGPQYEIGAGRIHDSHQRVHALIRRFGLHTIPIGPEMEWRSLHGANNKPTDWLQDILALQTKPRSTLAHHTVRELLPAAKRPTLLQFPYRAEVDLLRADLALESFRGEMGTGAGYVGIREGIDAITHGLARDLKRRGVRILTRHRVQDVRRLGAGEDDEGAMFEIVGDKGKKATAKPFRHTVPQVIIATCRCSLSDFSVLRGDPMLRHIQTSPLTRIYAQWSPEADGKCWWSRMGLQKTVTDSPLRFVIPIDPTSGLIMISYTDGVDTDVWKGLDGAELQTKIMKCVRLLWPDVEIPEPAWVRKHEWPSGCSYWVPGDYDVEAEIRRAMSPSEGVFVVGESIARRQAWIESALEVVEAFLGAHVVRKNRTTRQKMPGRRRSTRRLNHCGGNAPFIRELRPGAVLPFGTTPEQAWRMEMADRESAPTREITPEMLRQQEQQMVQKPGQPQISMVRQPVISLQQAQAQAQAARQQQAQQQAQAQAQAARQQQAQAQAQALAQAQAARQQQAQAPAQATRQQQAAWQFMALTNRFARAPPGGIPARRGGARKTRRRNSIRRRNH